MFDGIIKDPTLSDFFTTIVENTDPDAQNFGRVWNEAVKLHVFPSAKGALISSLRAFNPGQGHARQCMQWVCQEADRCGIALHLLADVSHGHGEDRVEYQLKLLEWYKSLGFTQEGDNKAALIRHPQSVRAVQPEACAA